MKRNIFSKFAMLMGMLAGAKMSVPEAKAAGIQLPSTKGMHGNVRGDHFYQRFQYKRVKGSWTLKK